jgi:hypothetical protein
MPSDNVTADGIPHGQLMQPTPGQILMERTIHGSDWRYQSDETREKWERHANDIVGSVADDLRREQRRCANLESEISRLHDLATQKTREAEDAAARAALAQREADRLRNVLSRVVVLPALTKEEEYQIHQMDAIYGYNLARSRAQGKDTP